MLALGDIQTPVKFFKRIGFGTTERSQYRTAGTLTCLEPLEAEC